MGEGGELTGEGVNSEGEGVWLLLLLFVVCVGELLLFIVVVVVVVVAVSAPQLKIELIKSNFGFFSFFFQI